MQLGKTLVGAVIGAALGIGLLFAANLLLGLDQVWLAIPVALLTGIGVRLVVATTGHASYLRGAITVLLALGAYLGGWYLVAAVANHRAANAPQADNKALAAAEKPAGEPGSAKEHDPEASPDAPQNNPLQPSRQRVGRLALPHQFSVWDYVSLAVAALLAYELGRGTGGVPRDTTQPVPSGAAPAGTHPDA